jgi:ribonucleoside-diphosphate reductase alpha chain
MANEQYNTTPSAQPVNLQTRERNRLSELGEKIFLDRYAIKDIKRETFAVGDTVIVNVNLKTGQREIGVIDALDMPNHTVNVKLRDGSIEVRDVEHVDKPLETVPEQMFERIARHIASVEKTPALQQEWQGKFRTLMDDWKYVPAGRIFTGAGTGQNLTFYNCYVIPCPDDSRGGIFETLSQMAEIMSRGGGVGINLSTLRPRYSYVKGVNGRSSGAVSWGSLYSFVTGLIEQGGSRRGALMLILNVWHPDTLDFINAKREAGKITNANISVGVTDDFMAAVKADGNWDFVFPDTADPLYKDHWAGTQGDIRKWREMGGKVITYKTVKAREIWNQMISSAWASAEPGMYFIDRSNYYSNSYYYASLPCTNPCGEQPLPAWGVCNLGHVNLAKHYDAVAGDVDWNELKQTVQHAIRFQDNVIDATPYFFKENEKQQMGERRVGMGTLGLAELLIKLKIRYGSDEAVEFLDKLYQFIAVTAYETSVDLAKEKGAFAQFDAEKFLESGYMKTMPEYVRSMVRENGLRNVTLMTQAPTGTVGTMVGTSTGIEPFFSWTYFRKARLGVHEEKIAVAQEWLDANPGAELPEYFVNAMQLAPEDHVKVQAAIQRWTDSAISKTCNAPADYTVEQTAQLYEMMYDLGCKGGTIYRDASRDEQILATDVNNLGKDVVEQMAKNKQKAEMKAELLRAEVQVQTEVQAKADALADDQAELPVVEAAVAAPIVVEPESLDDEHAMPEESDMLHVDAHSHKVTVKQLIQNGIRFEVVPRARPDEMRGTTYKTKTSYGDLYVTVNEDEHGPFEVFAVLGKSGGFFAAQSEGICRLISLGLRSGVAVAEIIKQIKGIRSTEVAFNDGEMIYSLPDAIGKVLEKHMNKNQQKLQLEFKSAQPAESVPALAIKIQETVPVSAAPMAAISSNVSQRSIADMGFAPICPNCSGMLRMEEGCMKCPECGYAKCG